MGRVYARAVTRKRTMTAIDAPTTVRGAFDALAPSRFVPGARSVSEQRLTTSVAPFPQPAVELRRLWERRYARRLLITDTFVVFAVTAAAQFTNVLVNPMGPVGVLDTVGVPALTAASWLVMLAAFHTRAASVVGSGATEYKRVAHSTGLAFGLVAILFLLFETPGTRVQLMIALPAGLLGLLVARWSWRRWLGAQRRAGRYAARTIVAGTRDDVEYVIRTLQGSGAHGHLVVGVATDDGNDTGDTGADLIIDGRHHPVLGSAHTVASHARQLGADSVIVASRPADDPDYIKQLSWQLEGTAAELILSSRLADVAGPRISLRPIDGLPLIHVRIPEFEGSKHVLKRATDVLFASIALIPTALVTGVVAVLIKLDDRGPVFFRQTRIGRNGEEFSILKFRTMRTTAESELAALQTANEGAGPLFKLKHDPRITRVGRILRKLSLDELPQFWNVLVGDMSVVGPRPPLPREVTAYNGTVYRRLYIKPGITGLWQVSGRSDLSWDESVRLDLRYVENWSIMTDLMIMWRTAQVMIRPKGAY
ncbi:sugar transferase [uncultured Microbacterium sp.]|uniref:sugar transferase n=1 Tax=uncultured Microbacterium sp. TaxID=191216 RepID=UPI0035CC05C4